MRNLKSIILGLMISALSTVAFADGHWSTIKIGTEGAYEPWNFTDSDGNLVGAELDLARDLCCLLYTSPSPRDLSTSRMPSSA